MKAANKKAMIRPLAVLAILVSVFLLALAIPAAHEGADHPLAPLEFLVGGSWLGTFPDGTQTDEHRYEWLYGKKFLRDVHVVRRDSQAVYQGETIYGWDPNSEQIFFWYWASSGGVSQGSVRPEGGLLIAEESHVGREGIAREESLPPPSRRCLGIFTKPAPGALRPKAGTRCGRSPSSAVRNRSRRTRADRR